MAGQEFYLAGDVATTASAAVASTAVSLTFLWLSYLVSPREKIIKINKKFHNLLSAKLLILSIHDEVENSVKLD